MREWAGQAVMMTMQFFGPMPVLELPLRDSDADSLHKVLVCPERRVVGVRRACAAQAVMMTMLMHCATLSFAEQMPILERPVPFAEFAWRDLVKMPISHSSANLFCIHDEDDKREVRLKMRRWSKNGGLANEIGSRETDDSPGPSAAPLILRLASSDYYMVVYLFPMPYTHAVLEMCIRVIYVPSLRHECLINWHKLQDRQFVGRCEQIVRSSDLLLRHTVLAYYWRSTR
jgi:hypothetical protein